jgi:hypothetical protein
MCSVAVLWESIMPVVIQNCFAECGFGTPCEVSTEEDEDDKWVEFQVMWIGPVISTSFSMLTNLPQPVMVRRQVWTALAASTWHHLWQLRKKRRQEMHLLLVRPAC